MFVFFYTGRLLIDLRTAAHYNSKMVITVLKRKIQDSEAKYCYERKDTTTDEKENDCPVNGIVHGSGTGSLREQQ